LRALDAGVIRPVVREPPAESLAVEALGLLDVGDGDLDVVDGVLPGRRWLRPGSAGREATLRGDDERMPWKAPG
jgi:hypothetical protein